MPPKVTTTVRSAIIIFSGLVSVSVVAAQSVAPAVEDAIKAQYKLSKFGRDSNGWAVAQAGTVLTLQQGGLLGIPPERLVFCSAKYENDQLKAAGGFCAAAHRNVSRFLQKGDKVYVFRIDENIKKEQISFKVVECDSCNGTDPPSFYKSEVVFQFHDGYLETAQPGPVLQTISQVFSPDKPDKGDAQQQAAPAVPAPAPATAATAPPAPIPPPPPPVDQPPASIDVGQTIDQVVAALGQPQRTAKVGAKQIYFYKDLKVTFTNGKVSDVE
jgi:hypothetical protein